MQSSCLALSTTPLGMWKMEQATIPSPQGSGKNKDCQAMVGKATRAALDMWDGWIDCPRESTRIFLCKIGDKSNEKAHAAHLSTAGLCKGSSKQMLLQDDLFPQEKNSCLSLFSLFTSRTTSFFKVVVSQKHYWLTYCLSTLLEMGLNLGVEKMEKQPESAVHVHQDEWGGSDGKTDDTRELSALPSILFPSQPIPSKWQKYMLFFAFLISLFH